MQANPDVARSGFDPLEHYLKHGWKEKRKPNPNFDPVAYLRDHPKLIEPKKEPLSDHLRREQERQRRHAQAREAKIAETNLRKQNELKKQAEKIAPLFDADYYLAQYPDVKDSKLDPLVHYLTVGWKVGYNPNSDFDTTFYLNSNPDVKANKVEPFYHYLTIGKNERRNAKHPGGDKVKFLESLHSWDKTVAQIAPIPGKIKTKRCLVEALQTFNIEKAGGVVFSFSHNKFNENIGGIQVCISEESKILSANNFIYINISPAQYSSLLADCHREWVGDLIINNQDIGSYREDDILDALRTTLRLDGKLFLIIHALHGHKIPFIVRCGLELKISKTFFWIHDYFSLCPSSHFLRNNITYCHGPNPQSQACAICIYGEKRDTHLEEVADLFEALPIHVLAPSQHALNLWQTKNSFKYLSAQVHEHRRIIYLQKREQLSPDTDRQLKIAYLGLPVAHKGWLVFSEVVHLFRKDPRYDFFHFGYHQDKTCQVKFEKVRVDCANITAMTDALRAHEIHAVFVWSDLPETYSIVMYEAFAAGVPVVTIKESGNIAAQVSQNGLGVIFNNKHDLLSAMQSNQLIESIRAIITKKSHFCSLNSSGITTSLICKELPQCQV